MYSRREDAQARLEEATAAHAHAHERANGLSKQLIDVAAINTGLSASLAQRELELAAAQAAAIQQATAVAEITAACSTLQMRRYEGVGSACVCSGVLVCAARRQKHDWLH